jgi:hypothetical protein
VTPGIINPEASLTVPPMLPYTACAAAFDAGAANITAKTSAASRSLHGVLARTKRVTTLPMGHLLGSVAADGPAQAELEPEHYCDCTALIARILAPIAAASRAMSRYAVDLHDAAA